MLTGIYKITNMTTGKFYIGSAMNVEKRWNEHRLELTKGNHRNRHLQKASNKYGASVFVFSVVQECSLEEIIKTEQAHLDLWFLNCPELLYNIAKNVTVPMFGLRHTEETKAKMREACKRRPLGWKENLKIAATGRAHSEETKAKLRAANIGKKASDETKQKMSEALSGKNNPMFGKKHSLMTKQKMRKPKMKISNQREMESKNKC
jgi:group I intron endonuclease